MEKLLIPEIIEALETGRTEYINSIFSNLHPGDASDIMEELPIETAVSLIKILPTSNIIEIMEEVDPEKFIEVFELMDNDWIADILDGIPPDDGVDLITLLPDDRVGEVLTLMNRAESRKVEELLPYPENSAGAVMTTEVTTLPADITVEKAVNLLRKLAPRRETIYYIYITDKNRRLLGTLSFEDLVFAKKDIQLKDIMDTNVISRNVKDDKEDVARDIQKYDFIAMPIVADGGTLVGIVTYDDVMDILVDESAEDTQLMAAVEPLKSPYLYTGFWSLMRRRIIWLAMLFIGEFLSAINLRNFQGTLESMITIAFFIPLIIATAGNTGTQSASLIISGLALGEIDIKKWLRIFTRELLMGMVMGIFLGLMGILTVYYLDGNITISIIVSSTLLIMIIIATILGSMLPFLFLKLGLDPAFTSTPFVTTTLDIIGIIIYLSIATLVINYFV